MRAAHLGDGDARVLRRLRGRRLDVVDDREPRRARTARRSSRQVRADPAPHMASGRDGGPDPGVRAHPRGDDGHGRRLSARACSSDLRSGSRHSASRSHPGRGHASRRRSHRARAMGHQARDRLLDDVADRLHVHGRGSRRLRLRDLPPDDARLLQGAALHVGRRRDPPPRRGAGHPPDGRPERRDAANSHRVPRRCPRAGRHPSLRRLLVEGRDPRLRARDRRDARLDALRRRARRGAPHRCICVSPLLHGLPRRSD